MKKILKILSIALLLSTKVALNELEEMIADAAQPDTKAAPIKSIM